MASTPKQMYALLCELAEMHIWDEKAPEYGEEQWHEHLHGKKKEQEHLHGKKQEQEQSMAEQMHQQMVMQVQKQVQEQVQKQMQEQEQGHDKEELQMQMQVQEQEQKKEQMQMHMQMQSQMEVQIHVQMQMQTHNTCVYTALQKTLDWYKCVCVIHHQCLACLSPQDRHLACYHQAMLVQNSMTVEFVQCQITHIDMQRRQFLHRQFLHQQFLHRQQLHQQQFQQLFLPLQPPPELPEGLKASYTQ